MISSTHLHAMLVHFPIALILVGLVTDIIGIFSARPFFRQASIALLSLGTLGVIAAFLSGQSAGSGMEEGSLGKAVLLHEQAAQFTLWLSIAALLLRGAAELLQLRQPWIRISAFLLLAFSSAAVARTGYLGGQLVFKHAAGVELTID